MKWSRRSSRPIETIRRFSPGTVVMKWSRHGPGSCSRAGSCCIDWMTIIPPGRYITSITISLFMSAPRISWAWTLIRLWQKLPGIKKWCCAIWNRSGNCSGAGTERWRCGWCRRLTTSAFTGKMTVCSIPTTVIRPGRRCCRSHCWKRFMEPGDSCFILTSICWPDRMKTNIESAGRNSRPWRRN